MRQAIRQILFGEPRFTPSALYRAGQVGAVYDPAQWATTMFQDSAGTTPVTALEQPVGLMLDTKAGVPVLGPELVTNGGFTSWAADNPSGWTLDFSEDATNFVTHTVNGMRLVCDDTKAVQISQSGVLTGGKTYLVAVVCTQFILGKVSIGFSGGTVNGTFAVDAVGTKTAIITNTTTQNLIIRRLGQTDLTIRSISVREIPGNHAIQATLTARATLKGSPTRLFFDADPDSLTVNFATSPGNSTVAYGVAGGDPVINYPVNISGTTYALNPTNTGSNLTGCVIINRELTAPEIAKLTAYLRRLG